jgi:two-component system, LuxR family, sensor histidine kinase TtrS
MTAEPLRAIAPPEPKHIASLTRLLVATLLALCLALVSAPAARADEVRIGVLALRGAERALSDWQPMADYLARRLPQHRFVIVPLAFDDIHLAVRQRRIDFVLANSAYYVELEMLYHATPVVTLRTREPTGDETSAFGGVIFTRADRRDVRGIEDLRGKPFAAVDAGSFGGWHAGWRELLHHGIVPERHLERLDFLGTHDAVVLAVRDGQVAAGTARTGTLESMAREGSIVLSDFHVLAERRVEHFPFLLSTALYPEWPLARLAGVPEALAVDVAVALLQMPQDAGHAGWSLPLNYQPVHDALRELRIGPYRHLRQINPAEVLRQYWPHAVAALLALLIALGASARFGRLNRRLRVQQSELGQLNASLEQRVAERTERVETLLQREQHLRGIVETVADVNQIIITSAAPADMLKASCDRLVAHRDYRFAWVALARDGRLATEARSYGSAELIARAATSDGNDTAARAFRDNCSVVGSSDTGLGGTAVAALPLRADAFAAADGVLCVVTARASGFDGEEMAMLEQLAGDLGFALHAFAQQSEASQLQQERISNYEETILSFVDMIEKRDTYTAGHTRRVAEYCGLLGRHLGLSAEELSCLTHAATLHDIGKIVIPDAVLLKPGRLTPLEYELIKQHVTVGYETLGSIATYRELAEVMRHHHEWIDGSGYPAQLRGEAIPFLSRIMAVADAFDAMTSILLAWRRHRCRAPLRRPCRPFRPASGAGGWSCRYRPHRSPSRWPGRPRRSCRRPRGRRWRRR